jgi:ribonuclease J
MTAITFYGGINTIGGNKILVEDKGVRIFLDFGMNFKEQQSFFTEFMPMRKCMCIKDLIALGLLPDIKGLYREDYCRHMKLDADSRNSADAVLVSHSHVDHIGYIHFLRKSIPIYISPESKAVMSLFDIAGAGTYNDYLKFNPCFEFIPKKSGGLKKRTAKDGLEERQIKTFAYEKPFKIGHIEITPYRVDHSLPGATGFIIKTSDKIICYTGDLRFHGRHKDWTDKFVEACKSAKPDILLAEGTRIISKTANTEEYVEIESSKIISKSSGLVIANLPLRDTDRLLTFYNTALKNKRKLVIEPRQALLLDLLKAAGVKDLPSPKDENIRIFFPKREWGLIGREDIPYEHILGEYEIWEQPYFESKNAISAQELSKNQDKYILFMNSFQLNNLLDINPVIGSVHIRSVCEPFSDEMTLDEERVNNWLKKFKLFPTHQIHASGHASGNHLLEMVKKISPKILIPIHTEHAEIYEKEFPKITRMAKKDERMEF